MRDFTLVLLAGLEPARYFYRGILSPLRLPISPQQHSFLLNFILYNFFIFSARGILSPLRLPVSPQQHYFFCFFGILTPLFFRKFTP